ncbi:FtsB family cell division protein [Mycetocola spongiae]|uniref:FtsB family cell division protein n=1 Tax=Mycetocola spongiae TaxID=2859226 RepID=UPI001CF0D788|nr:septum formation initiator family protein [Mycetocola spongiae]UCR88976.1 septum formation initiator family protein [Mycetocola spongiae]
MTSTTESTAARAGWVRRLRFSGFSAIMLGVIIVGVLIVAPNLKMYVEQRQQIAALEKLVAEDKTVVKDLTAERQRWNDKTYIETQARDRLYYVNPGEITFIVKNDLDPGRLGGSQPPISEEVQATSSDWSRGLLGSFLEAGLGENAPTP